MQSKRVSKSVRVRPYPSGLRMTATHVCLALNLLANNLMPPKFSPFLSFHFPSVSRWMTANMGELGVDDNEGVWGGEEGGEELP